MTKGVDVSTFQGSVDWDKVVRAGYGFAICKCSEGQDFKDPTWGRERVRAIRKAGMKVGAYHYLRPRPGRSGAVEARHAVETAKSAEWGREGDIRLVVDIEETALAGKGATWRYLREFVLEAKRLTGHKPIIYTFPSFWIDLLGNPSNLGCPLWIANPDVRAPKLPAAWASYAIWQTSFTGSVPGIAGHVDLNVARTLPVIKGAKAKPPADHDPPKPKRRLTLRQKRVRRARRAKRKYLRTGANHALRVWLVTKARLGRWDVRYCAYYGVDPNVSAGVKKFITRAYAAGLVPTSTTGGAHAPGSYHYQHRAADEGLRRELVGTTAGLRRMERFQHAEFKRFHRTGALELIGPLNDKCVLRGDSARLGEGTALETMHDNHVHGGF